MNWLMINLKEDEQKLFINLFKSYFFQNPEPKKNLTKKIELYIFYLEIFLILKIVNLLDS